MKKIVLLCAVLAIGIFASITLLRPAQVSALNVNEVGADPTAFVGTITVTGITAGFAQKDPTLFGIMDKKELQCTTPNCKKFLLPVRTNVALPAVGDEVRVTGSFVGAGGSAIFVAERVEVVRHHNLGARG